MVSFDHQFDTTLVTWKKKVSNEEVPQSGWHIFRAMSGFLIGIGEPGPLWAAPLLDYIKIVDGHKPQSESPNSVPPWFLLQFLLEFLLQLPKVMVCWVILCQLDTS